MGLIKRAHDLDRFFNERAFILDSPGVRAEKQPDGRVQLHVRKPVVVSSLVNPITIEGFIDRVTPPLASQHFGPFTWGLIPDDVAITRIGQYKPNTVAPYTSYFQSGVDFEGGGFQVAPNSLGIWDDATNFFQVFAKYDSLSWHFELSGINTLEATVDLSPGSVDITYDFAYPYIFRVKIAYVH